MRLLKPFRRSMSAVSFIALFAAPALPLEAQNQQKYSSATFRKSQEGKEAEHRRFLTTAWLKSAEHGVSKGDLHGAMALRLAGAAQVGSDYDYVTVTYPVKTPNLAQASGEELDARAKAAGYADRAAYRAALRSTSTAVRAGASVLRAQVGTVPKGSFLRVVQWEIPAEHRAAVAAFNRDYTIPMMAARVKQGAILGWSMITPAVVSPEEAGWAQATVTVVKDGERAFAGGGQGPMNEETFKSLVPGKSYAAYIRQSQEIGSMRKRVRTRLYEVVAAVGTVPSIGVQ